MALEKYLILRIHAGIIPEKLESNVPDLVESLLKDDVLSFRIQQVKDEKGLLKHYDYLNAICEGKDDETVQDRNIEKVGPLVGYYKKESVLYISDPEEKIRGGVQVIKNKLVYSERGLPLHGIRDSVIFGLEDEFYTTRNFLQVLEEFVEKEYELFSFPGILPHFKSEPTPPPNPQNLMSITLDQIR